MFRLLSSGKPSGFVDVAYSALQEGSGWGEESKCTAFVVVVGASSNELRYLKSIALELYLFSYELPGNESW